MPRRPDQDYVSCLRQIERRNGLVLSLGGLFHLFLFTFTEAAYGVAQNGLLVSFICLLAFALFVRRHLCKVGRHETALRSVKWDTLFVLAVPLPFYLLTLLRMPVRSLIGLLVLALQTGWMWCHERKLTEELRERLRLRRLAIRRRGDPNEWLPVAAEAREIALVIMAGLVAMLLYNGGQRYCVPPPAMAVLVRQTAAAATAFFLFVQVLHVAWIYHWPAALLKHPGSAFRARLRRLGAAIASLPWSAWGALAASLAAMLCFVQVDALKGAALPFSIVAHGLGAFFFHKTFGRTSRVWLWLLRHPAQMLISSFASLIALATYLFMLPACHVGGTGLPFVQALFTATSGTCITGLTVVSTANDLSHIGQMVLLVVIQLGAVGVMTISSFVAIVFSRNLGLLASSAIQDATGEDRSLLAKQLVRLVVPMTLSFEAIGALILTPYLHAQGGVSWLHALWEGVFMSVNAFCNAGFTLTADGSYACFATQPVPLLTSAVLLILGGMGCGVLAGVWSRLFSRRPFRLEASHQLVLWSTLILVGLGTLCLLGLEGGNTLNGYGLRDRVVNAFFNAASARSAGFASIDLSATRRVTDILLRILMFIGSAPGSTGGGVKVTTVAVLFLMLWHTARGREHLTVARRTIPPVTVHRAAAVVLMNLLLILAVTLALSVLMPDVSLNRLSFEAVSASSTVGLGIGLEERLGTAGQLLIVLTMFAGRIGMLTTLSMFASGARRQPCITYPNARIPVG